MDAAALHQAAAFQQLLGVASFFTLCLLAARRRRGETWLPYEPRPAPPWGAWAPVLLLAPAAVGVVEGALRASGEGAADPVATGDFARQTWLAAASLIALTLAFAGALHVMAGATPRDLGLPLTLRQGLSDAALGAVVCLASILPVFGMVWLLREAFDPQSQHPFLQRILAQPSAGLLAAISFSAMVAAPLFEEFAFRLVLQGWLQRWEDQRLCQRESQRRLHMWASLAEVRSADGQSATETHSPHAEEGPGRGDSTTEAASAGAAVLPETLPANVPGWWPAAPRGWLPIGLSSLAFGAAHWGHGIDPAALVLLGVFLGYAYQRTGRLAPCIVAHALFNGVTMVVLALQLRGLAAGS